MKIQRNISLLMVVAVASCQAIASDATGFAIAMCFLGMIGHSGRFSKQLSSSRHTIAMLIIALVFAAIGRDSPYGIKWHLYSQCLLGLMVAQFYLYRKRENLSLMIFLGMGSILCIGQLDSVLKGRAATYFQLFGMMFILLSVAFCSSSRKAINRLSLLKLSGRSIIATIVILSGLIGGIVSGEYLYEYRNELENTLMNISAQRLQRFINRDKSKNTSVGFGNNGELSTVKNLKQENDMAVRLNVFSDQTPGYLRCQVYDSLNKSKWSSLQTSQDISPDTIRPKNVKFRSNANTFTLKPSESQNYTTFEIYPSADLDAVMFMPLGTTIVQAPVESIYTVIDNGVTDSEDMLTGINYTVALPGTLQKETLLEVHRKQYLKTPDNLDIRIRQRAKEIFAGCTNTSDKVDAVLNYFLDNGYSYQLGIDVPNGQDPVTYFITHRPPPPAHCEYFASAAAILLRLADVPTRYTTGFVTQEFNPCSKSFVARSRDAHAWVEVWYESKQRWLPVEATIAGGIPGNNQQAEQASTPGYFWEYIKLRFQQLMVSIQTNGFSGFLLWLIARLLGLADLLLTTWPGILVTILIVFIIGKRPIVKYIQRRRALKLIDPNVRAMQLLLMKMDKQIAMLGYTRNNTQSIHQFARQLINEPINPRTGQLKQAAKWYQKYAELRYLPPEKRNNTIGILSDLDI